MLTLSTRTLKISAALFWYTGSIVLFLKGSSLLLQANRINPKQHWIWLAIIIGMLFGLIKAKYLFRKICKNNIARINLLDKPKAWQFFRPGFFLFLTIMILVGTALSNMAHDNYPFLISVAILDFSLATALLASSYVFWKNF